MPHVILEHTTDIADAIDSSDLLKTIHMEVVNAGLFSPEAVKSRKQPYDTIVWGAEGMHTSFAHATIKILIGRTIEQRKTLSQSIFAKMREALPDVEKLSVDIHEMEKETYCK